MATDLKSYTVSLSLTRFWGGEGCGHCLQVTGEWNGKTQHIQLTRTQAEHLALDLLMFAQGKERELDTE